MLCVFFFRSFQQLPFNTGALVTVLASSKSRYSYLNPPNLACDVCTITKHRACVNFSFESVGSMEKKEKERSTWKTTKKHVKKKPLLQWMNPFCWSACFCSSVVGWSCSLILSPHTSFFIVVSFRYFVFYFFFLSCSDSHFMYLWARFRMWATFVPFISASISCVLSSANYSNFFFFILAVVK